MLFEEVEAVPVLPLGICRACAEGHDRSDANEYQKKHKINRIRAHARKQPAGSFGLGYIVGCFNIFTQKPAPAKLAARPARKNTGLHFIR